MPPTPERISTTLPRDLTAGLVVFFVALPLCLGVSLAANAPLFSGLVAGVIGGIVVGLLSGSQTSVSGPSPGLIAVVAAQIAILGSFQTFLLALAVAGLIQIALGCARLGFLAAFFPSNVIKGLLAAIGVILILKQLPHVVGHDPDPEGEMSFEQPDHRNTFSELIELLEDIHPGAALIGILSTIILVLWSRVSFLKRSSFPAPLAVVLFGVGASRVLAGFGKGWLIEPTHLVQVKVTASFQELLGEFQSADFFQWANPAVYIAALTIAGVATLETLLNLEAVDKIDPQQRNSPPNRELLAQGVGNFLGGLVGGLPISSVIVRSSVNINAGSRTKLSAVVHGALLFVSVAFLPAYLNLIPISCLAAILFTTGVKLASPKIGRQMWREGWNQFVPFVVTVVAIVLTDLLIGVLIGLGTGIGFILRSNVRRPIRRVVEKHLGGEVVRIELANQVSFLNRAAIARALDEVPAGGHVLLDAQATDYIDPDVLGLILDFKEVTAPARGVEVSLVGFRDRYPLLRDQTQYVDYSTREIQSALSPPQVLQLLKDGNERFLTGHRLTRDLGRQVHATAAGQHPLAVVLSCIDSRTPAELIFDLGMGDIFSVRLAGNVTSRKALGSIEYGTAVAGAKLVVVMGHTRCGAVTAAVNLACSHQSPAEATGCQHIHHVVGDIQKAIVDPTMCQNLNGLSPADKQALVNEVARLNVVNGVREMTAQSRTLAELVREGKIVIVGAMYDVATGAIEFLTPPAGSLAQQ
ncbi:bifunctional SulP family inorganic anion transporter/carbonic anhydrase [Limnoglobus roseus]|uniref:Sulfate transporter n=1 Tax=Limnoglobus roseus TaxID=2598579 RepID=A0A5C1ARW8_9BACT|nr:SulP family inorganic anion transporter [Limnoglobus roseus]QEL20833.1 sulfate transporter [Limnoglobus roseus]